MTITNFTGDLFYLDNTYPFPLEHNGIVYDSLATAFVAVRTNVEKQRRVMSNMDYYRAALYFSDHCATEPSFLSFKKDIFLKLFHAKFDDNEDDYLVRALKATTGLNDTFIYENTDCDNFLGVCVCPKCTGRRGSNILGKALTELRHSL